MSISIAVPQRPAGNSTAQGIVQDCFNLATAVNDQAPTFVASWDLEPNPQLVTESSRKRVRIQTNFTSLARGGEAIRSKLTGDGRTRVNAELLMPGGKYRGTASYDYWL